MIDTLMGTHTAYWHVTAILPMQAMQGGVSAMDTEEGGAAAGGAAARQETARQVGDILWVPTGSIPQRCAVAKWIDLSLHYNPAIPLKRSWRLWSPLMAQRAARRLWACLCRLGRWVSRS